MPPMDLSEAQLLPSLSLAEVATDLFGPEVGATIAHHLLLIARAVHHDFIVDWAEATARTSLSKRTIQRLMQDGDFPPRVELSEFRSGWRNSDLDRWIRSRTELPHAAHEN
jgi:predicted DNA-binding transcriptional regulator AlpA